MRELLKDVINDLIELFENSPRMGKERDEPEGVCYIQISDTLANIMAAELRECLELGPPHNEVE